MKCTRRAAELLKENRKLKVHSVYRHTVNIVVKGRILAFHRDIIPATPLSLVLPFSEEEFEYFEREAQRTGLISIHIFHENGQLFPLTETQQNEIINSHKIEELFIKSSDQYCWISVGNFKQSAGEIILWEDKLDKKYKSKKLNLNPKDEGIEERILSILLPVLTKNYQLGGFSDCAVTTEKRQDDSFITQILREKTAAILSKDILGDASESVCKAISGNTSENINILEDIPENISGNTSEVILKNETASKDNKTNFEKLICSLIGLGPGLTPSGDDFLTGILLAFSLKKNVGTYIETENQTDIRKNIRTKTDREIAIIKELDRKQQQICKVASENLDRTNDISKEYLLCAMENRFGELYHELQEQLYCGNVQQDIFRRIIRTGHSSGLDTLNGLAIGLKMIRMMMG